MKRDSLSTYRLLLFRIVLAVGGFTLYNYIIIQIDDFLVLVDKQREIKSNKVQLLKQQKKWWWGGGMWLSIFQGCFRVSFHCGLSSASDLGQNKPGLLRCLTRAPGAWCTWALGLKPALAAELADERCFCQTSHYPDWHSPLQPAAVGVTEASSSIFQATHLQPSSMLSSLTTVS